eukprot:194197-Rhodomonas_salina.1
MAESKKKKKRKKRKEKKEIEKKNRKDKRTNRKKNKYLVNIPAVRSAAGSARWVATTSTTVPALSTKKAYQNRIAVQKIAYNMASQYKNRAPYQPSQYCTVQSTDVARWRDRLCPWADSSIG